MGNEVEKKTATRRASLVRVKQHVMVLGLVKIGPLVCRVKRRRVAQGIGRDHATRESGRGAVSFSAGVRPWRAREKRSWL